MNFSFRLGTQKNNITYAEYQGGHGNPLQYSCLENPMNRGAWRTTVHGVTKSRTRLKRLGTHIGVQNTSMMVLAYQIWSAVGGLVSFSLPSVQGNKV